MVIDEMKLNESALILSAFENGLRAGLVVLAVALLLRPL